METEGAYILRENTGTSGIEATLRTAVAMLEHWDIPHLVAGGLAVQEHGYFRVTLDADIIVPDVQEAVEFLISDLTGPFVRFPPGCEDTVQDRRNGVHINFLPAGRVLRRGCQVPFPEPRQVSPRPVFISLGELISLKLDSWTHSPMRRHKDKTDVIELIKSKHLPRELAVADPVRAAYTETWDALRTEE